MEKTAIQNHEKIILTAPKDCHDCHVETERNKENSS